LSLKFTTVSFEARRGRGVRVLCLVKAEEFHALFDLAVIADR
jgi:hypothetical protein